MSTPLAHFFEKKCREKPFNINDLAREAHKGVRA